MKHKLLLILILALITTFTGCSSTSDDYSEDSYEGTDFSEPSSNYDEPSEILQIQDGWTWTTDGDYTYIKGSIRNSSAYPVEYWEITAEYLDASGQVLDSDYTNDGQTLNSGDMKEFEIMHENNPDYDKVQIYVNEAD